MDESALAQPLSLASVWYLRRRPHYQSGHSLRLLTGGAELFPAMVAAIDAAQERIGVASYIVHDDAMSRSVVEALARAARRGVQVQVVVDGFGSREAVPVLEAAWNGAPVQWVVFRPLDRWWSWFQAEHLRRMHLKLCAVDGRVAFVGGINLIDDRWDLHHGALESPRLDYAVEVRGPVCASVEHTVGAFWARARWGRDWRDELLRWVREPQGLRRARAWLAAMRWRAGAREVPGAGAPAGEGQAAMAPSAAAFNGGGASVAFLLRDNLRQRRSILRTLLQAVAQAQGTIDIACPYFFPGRALSVALREAARRGVRVRLLLQGRPDYRLASWAASALYAELLHDGVEIYEYTAAFLHAKAVCVDGLWSTVGSSNLDPLSLWVNYEANVAVQDGSFAAALELALEQALQGARRVVPRTVGGRWRGAWRAAALLLLCRLYLRLARVPHDGVP